jgi:1-acyl-sn-glycerol-3-phosphate acyltransferase
VNWAPKSTAPPPGYAYGDAYRPAKTNVLQAAYYISRGRPRSLAVDGMHAFRHVPAPPILRGADNVPEQGPFVLVANHYERPGLWMAWPAVYLSNVVWQRTGSELHWMAIEEWESFSMGGVRVPPWMTRVVFQRAYGTYGIIAMPSANAPAAARAGAMRSAVQTIKAGGVIGLMPEATVGPTPELLEAREGVGAFLLLLANAGARVLPVGLFEESARLVAQCGEPFALSVPRDVPKQDRDHWVRTRVMCAIRELLPGALWGAYSEESACSTEVAGSGTGARATFPR